MEINMEYLGYIVGVIAIIYGMYSKIRFDCLKKAAEKVAEAEAHQELDGAGRFELATKLLEKELPGTFIQSLIRNLLAQLIQHAYDNSKEFAEGYAKIKTGESISSLVEKLATPEEESSEDMNLDDCEE